MVMHKAVRVSITVEKLIQDKIVEVIEEEGASGYFVFEGGGKGQSGDHPLQRPAIVGSFGLVKIETVVNERAVAERIAEKIADRCFKSYSGIVYLDEVDVLRRAKF